MNIRECYEAAGGDFNDVIKRLISEERVAKFAVKFLNDQTYAEITAALAQNDLEAAFRGAHTLKGVSQNLGFAELHEVSDELTEMLRPLQPADTADIMERLKASYEKVINAINCYIGSTPPPSDR